MSGAQRGTPDAGEAVVLVHGLWLGGWVCRLLGHWFHDKGLRVHYFDYPSTRAGVAANAARLADYARSINARTLHFVGHSLGGLIAARSLIDQPDPRPGRIVLLGSPFAGCNAAARLESNRIGAALIGRSIRDWLADRPSVWPGARELGVIAGCGRIGMGRIIVPDLARPNDGVVTVAETRVPGAADHIVLPVSHTAMLVSRRVADQSAHFLRHGHFCHNSD